MDMLLLNSNISINSLDNGLAAIALPASLYSYEGDWNPLG